MFTWETFDVPSNIAIAIAIVSLIVGYSLRVGIEVAHKIMEDE